MWEKCGKSESYLVGEAKSPLYSHMCENNCPCEMRRIIRRPLKDTCAVSDVRRHASARWRVHRCWCAPSDDAPWSGGRLVHVSALDWPSAGSEQKP